MNVETSTVRNVQDTNTKQVKNQSQSDSSVKFSDELKELKKGDEAKKADKKDVSAEKQKSEENKTDVLKETDKNKSKSDVNKNEQMADEIHSAVKNLSEVFNELNQKDEKNLSEVFNELNQKDEKNRFGLKHSKILADKENAGDNLINNDFKIRENKEVLPQMNPNMNFGGDGQPFSSFMNNSSSEKHSGKIDSTAQDLAEEAQILSTMAENIAMANKMNMETDSSEKTVMKNDGIKKIDTQTGITKETIVKFDSVVMNQADVEVFANLVNNKEINLQNLAPEAAQKSIEVSKTLADLLAKAMNENKPVRIDFDNDISVIIKISRDGKLTADFLPSSQVAEAYLKENLPLLRQRFDDENLEYNSLNQRERRGNEKEQQRKKGSENE